MQLSIYHHPKGLRTEGGFQVVYDLEQNIVHYGSAKIGGPALRWAIEKSAGVDALLTVRLALDRGLQWLLRCDRVDFPPGAIAYRHSHPGPGIRCLLFGRIEIETKGRTTVYGPLEAWYESGPEPVVAVASSEEAAAFVRVMLLPREWRGKRTVRYLDPADAERPKLQQARVYFDVDVQV
jgi:quercetin dioxygenase-like cupin family protein